MKNYPHEIIITDTHRIEREYTRSFEYTWERGCGFSFPCDKDGNILWDCMYPEGAENARKALAGEFPDLVDLGVKIYDNKLPLCRCGSGKERFELRDARGIFCDYVCSDCHGEKKAKYRPEIFNDSSYDSMDEQIEEDY